MINTPLLKRFRLLDFLIGLLSVFFLFSLFRHISYPLIWNDESETAMYGQRIIQYGYPKVSDNKNRIFLPSLSDPKIGIKENNDAYILTTWAQFYIASLGVIIGSFVTDFYQKTAILRSTFAIIGLLGLFIFIKCLASIFKDGTQKKISILLFIFFELTSISLILHIREARYYSIHILLSAIILYAYIQYRILSCISYRRFFLFMVLSLLLYYHAYFSGYFIFVTFFIVLECFLVIYKLIRYKNKTIFQRIQTIDKRKFFLLFFPYVSSLIILIPSFYYFRTIKVLTQINSSIPLTGIQYVKNVAFILTYFAKYEFSYLMVVLKIVSIFLRFKKQATSDVDFQEKLYRISDSISLLFVFYLLMIARTPFLFERYFINLQPLFVFIMIIDIIIVWNITSVNRSASPFCGRRFGLVILMAGIVAMNGYQIRSTLKGHIIEIVKRYQGPLDFIIPFIKDQFKQPEKLVIATNYEECSYMYYLGSKVIIGFNYDRMNQDASEKPDIIVYRRFWRWKHDPKIFKEYLKKESYCCVTFPVIDYPVNNIPDLHFTIKHLFRTQYTLNPEKQLKIFIRNDLWEKKKKSLIPYYVRATNEHEFD